MIDVPTVVRNKAVAVGAHDWVSELPGLVAELEHSWGFQTGRSYDGGTEAFVADATMADGAEAVLKVHVPREAHADREIAVLTLAGGDACPELYRSDPDRGALLMERLGPSLFDLRRPLGERLEILTDAARRIWRPASGLGLRAGAGWPTGDEKAAWLAANIERLWTEQGEQCSRRAIDHALACAERRRAAHDDDRAVLVHGDVHRWNALQAGDAFKLVDPDGLLAEPEYDLGILMREDPLDLLVGDPHRRARWLAERCDLDEAAIWEWGVVERVSTGLVATSIDLQPEGMQMLGVADRLAAID